MAGALQDTGWVAANAINNVEARFDVANSRATEMYENAKELFQGLQTMTLSSFSPTMPVWGLPIDIQPIDLNLIGEMPTMGDLPSDPGDTPVPAYPESPIRPSITLPTAPTLHDFTIPDVPEIGIPVFSAILPVDTSVVPGVHIEAGSGYDSSLLDALRATLENRIENGGTGLSASVEDAIWQREHEREELAMQDAMDKVAETWAAKGFSLPDGCLAEQFTQIHTEYMNKRLDRSRDIAIKQAELEQANVLKAIEEAGKLEHVLMTFAMDGFSLAFECSKAVAQASIDVFKSELEKYNIGVQAYRTQCEAYKIIVEGEIAKCEAFKVRIEGLKAIAMLDESMVKAYEAQIKACTTLVEMYKTDVQANMALIEAEKVKMEVFKVSVDAYLGKTNAIIEEYKGQIEGKKAYIQGIGAIEDVNAKLLGERIQYYSNYASLVIKQWEAALRVMIENKSINMEGAKTAASVAAAIAQGAMAGVTAIAEVSGRATASETYNQNVSS